MRRVFLLNALLSMPWTPCYRTSDSDDHDDDGSAGSGARDDSWTGDGWAGSSSSMQKASGDVSSSVGWG
jgi:hypothetical protein